MISEHEQIMSSYLDRSRIKNELFPDFWGEVKSLGAWGGDFYLVVSNKGRESTEEYFQSKGFSVFFDYDELIL